MHPFRMFISEIWVCVFATRSRYLKFGVYRGAWKGTARPTISTSSTIAYGGLKVGGSSSSFSEVSTAQRRLR
jgi:hypothetical protein